MGQHVIKMPDIGEGIAEVELVGWKVGVGDAVSEDQIVAEVMTDKATVEIPSPVAGTVLALGGALGETMAVGSELIRLEVAGEGNVKPGEAAAASEAAAEKPAVARAPEPPPRLPDPKRMLQAHAHSAMTMNFVRALIDGGFADLHHPEYWNLNWVGYSPNANEYQQMVTSIGDAVRFMETLSGSEVHNLNRIDFYTSHEALLLPYEEALTREVPRQWGWFNLSTHYPWIGMRTAAVDGAHVEYLRGVRNPIALKVGPSVNPDQLLRLIDILNPEDEPGRLTFIHRMGATQVAEKLPPLLDAVRRDGRRVLWVCDPMHGNTESTSNGYKTRRFANIRGEVEQSFDLHAAAGTRLGGVHLELTGEDVTECTGGARELTDIDLERAYRSTVDPRLNYEQSLEIAMSIVRKQNQLAAPATRP